MRQALGGSRPAKRQALIVVRSWTRQLILVVRCRPGSSVAQRSELKLSQELAREVSPFAAYTAWQHSRAIAQMPQSTWSTEVKLSSCSASESDVWTDSVDAVSSVASSEPAQPAAIETPSTSPSAPRANNLAVDF